MGTIYFWGNQILFEGGSIAFHRDCCCCEILCGPCTQLPTYFEVTLGGYEDDGCSDCEDLNDEPFVLLPTETACQWRFDWEVPPCGVAMWLILGISAGLLTLTLYVNDGIRDYIMTLWTFTPDPHPTCPDVLDCMAIDDDLNFITAAATSYCQGTMTAHAKAY